MPFAAQLAFALIAVGGHASLWVLFVNNIHGTAMPRWLMDWITHVAEVLCILPLAAIAWLLWQSPHPSDLQAAWDHAPIPLRFYGWFCLAWGLIRGPWWIWQRITRRHLYTAGVTQRSYVDLRPRSVRPVGTVSGLDRLFVRLPGNDAFRLELNEKDIHLPRLPQGLDGLSIIQLADLHFCGKVQQSFFRAALDWVQAQTPDVLVMTGDLVDPVECMPWIEELLAPLAARLGKFFILGNHDIWFKDASLVREAMGRLGWTYLGGRWQTAHWDGHEVLLAGNELPWIGPAADLKGAPPPAREGGPFRLLVAHTPDQFGWARRHEFDLVLAGHMHGGQYRLPVVGPFLAPSRQGVRYASGLYTETPSTLHVSRGLSCLTPWRINCPTEVSRLVLRAAPLSDHRSPAAAVSLPHQSARSLT
jgi:predicted MPP superfamily phosphohydrolase